MSQNVICPICTKKFHACNSCGLNHEWEYTFCSEKCYQASKEFDVLTKAQTLLLTSLDKKQLKALHNVFILNEGLTYQQEKELELKIK